MPHTRVERQNTLAAVSNSALRNIIHNMNTELWENDWNGAYSPINRKYRDLVIDANIELENRLRTQIRGNHVFGNITFTDDIPF